MEKKKLASNMCVSFIKVVTANVSSDSLAIKFKESHVRHNNKT